MLSSYCYADCHYAQCHYGECPGTQFTTVTKLNSTEGSTLHGRKECMTILMENPQVRIKFN
jgi:hypothetical protein